jgi:HEAT repeat protein
MAQVQGTERMMIAHVEETRRAFEGFARHPEKAAFNTLATALETPYPYAHYLAAGVLAKRGDKAAVPVLIKKLDSYVKVRDTVGFWWVAEALARLKAREAMPVLAKYAAPANPSGTFGPEGNVTGYIAARSLARIAADAADPAVARLVKNDNVWLRAGALRGLAEARAAGVNDLLRAAAEEDAPALVRYEARVQLNRLKK